MKTDIVSKMSRLSRALLAATLALTGSISVKAQGFFNNTITVGTNTYSLGNASGGTAATGYSNWAIFSLSGNVTITDPTYTGTYDVLGNVGIAGSGMLSMTASYIDGYVSEAVAGSTLAGNLGNPYFKGSIGINPAYLSQGVTDAINFSNAAAALTASSGTVSGTTVSMGTVLTTAVFTAGKTEANFIGGSAQANTTYVMNLTDLILQGTSAILTLHGTATTNYVFNVSRYMSLAGGAKILIDGSSGLTDANVLYNVKSNPTQYDVTLSGGSEAHGIILATTRAVKETGASKVYGEVIAKSVSLSGASKVINPFASP